ncbi:hypothetical protein BpJC7_04810 [Weizmannia acidilactici]|uniref:Fimbrial assembly family protein n=1 Tax=Weizmannia acidilactici TaxID=2607726 RepID=A0A5J4JFU2_9BACI|nr:PilN domain-containing protein [Weizmannia acidilactici]GER66185.1 hypothetical protein BpJC4_06560 [Weizmannia acidilactici]GER69178.1 hypothetical protein BpJC7_04810 [Weizmannia acidilactici]GER72125.1 hypothetical protein BpPP18_01920 [Weizmannia acidilactici]
MPVEINLLPKKEPKNMALLFWGGLLAAAFIIFLTVFFFMLHHAKQDLGAINEKIHQVEAMQAREQAKQKNDTDTQDLRKLASAVKWAKDYPVKAVPILDQLTKLLPKYGYITDFSCTETSADVTVQFESGDEVAYYLKRLNDSKYFSGAVLNNIKTDKKDTDIASSALTAASTSGSESTSGSGNSGSNAKTDTKNTDTSNTKAASGTNANAAGDTGSTAADTSSDLPVYLASYTVQLNKSALNAAAKKEEKQ